MNARTEGLVEFAKPLHNISSLLGHNPAAQECAELLRTYMRQRSLHAGAPDSIIVRRKSPLQEAGINRGVEGRREPSQRDGRCVESSC